MSATMTRPIMRYHGGKWKIGEWVIEHFPPHRLYVEPFCGAASVLMRKRPSESEVINDLDGDIVNVFRVLRDPAQARELERQMRLTPFARSEFETAYLLSGDPIERARRTLVRSFMAKSSAGPTARNRDGSYHKDGFRHYTGSTGPRPPHEWTNLPDHISLFCQRLRGVIVENRPACEIIERFDSENVLFYVDPPYVLDTRGDHRDRYAYEMTDEDHRHLSSILHQLDGMIALSGYPSALYDELYPDWKRFEHTAYADGARKRTECLWLNASAARGLAQLRMEII